VVDSAGYSRIYYYINFFRQSQCTTETSDKTLKHITRHYESQLFVLKSECFAN